MPPIWHHILLQPSCGCQRCNKTIALPSYDNSRQLSCSAAPVPSLLITKHATLIVFAPFFNTDDKFLVPHFVLLHRSKSNIWAPNLVPLDYFNLSSSTVLCQPPHYPPQVTLRGKVRRVVEVNISSELKLNVLILDLAWCFLEMNILLRMVHIVWDVPLY